MKMSATTGLPLVYLDANIYKFSATQLLRLIPRLQRFTWPNGVASEITIHDLRLVNRNFKLTPESKAETEVLPLLAELAKKGEYRAGTGIEMLFEVWGMPHLDSQSGKFYGAPVETIQHPRRFTRVIGKELRNDQIESFRRIRDPRFLTPQKWTGALDPKSKKAGNQLLDAYFLWTAEQARCDYFLTMDFKLVDMARTKELRVQVVKPSELNCILKAARWRRRLSSLISFR
jgi:hypothetical protein